MNLLKLLLVVILFAFSFSSSGADARLTKDQAIQIALKFCRDINAPQQGSAMAVFPIAKDDPASEAYYLPRWKITFSSGAAANAVEVEVADATGAVTGYFSSTVDEEIGEQPAAEGLPKATALQIAQNIYQTTGQTEQTLVESADLQQSGGGNPPSASGHIWNVSLLRQFNGIPYQDQDVVILLQAETGILIAMGINYHTPPPLSTDINISQAQADNIASAFVAGTGIENPVLDDTKIEVVRPCAFWKSRDETPLPGLPRIAYTYFFTSNEQMYQAWVDAQTGDIIGGWQTSNLSDDKPKPKLALNKALAKVQEVRIFGSDPKAGWSKKPLLVLNRRSQTKMFTAFKATKAAPNAGSLALAEYKFVLTAQGKPLCELRYMPKTGRVGADRSWGVVPARFKAWMQTLAPVSKPGRVALNKPR